MSRQIESLSLRERGRGEGRSQKLPLPPELLAFARSLRQQPPDAEQRMWSLLRDRRFLSRKFRRQYLFPPYVLDFYCDELKLAVELDGGQHAGETASAMDELRSGYLRKKGIQVVRYWNHDVLRDPEGVLQDLMGQMQLRAGPSPQPSPGGRGRKAVVSSLGKGRHEVSGEGARSK